MTEEEAKTRWCPFVRVVGETDRTWPLTNREERVGDQDRGAVSRCIASACMAWRWDGTHVNDPDDPKADFIWSNRSYGHCGLAGQPEPERAASLESRRAEAPQ